LQLGEADDSGNKWSIWLDGGIHAREHITPATVIYVADQVRRTCIEYTYIHTPDTRVFKTL